MRIFEGSWKSANAERTFAVPIEIGGRKLTLETTVYSRWQEFFTTDRLDGAVVQLLPTAMRLGENIKVEGAISAELAWLLETNGIPLLATLKNMRTVRIEAREYTTTPLCNPKFDAAMGFSGGVDSFSALFDLLKRPNLGPKLDVLMFNDFSSRRRRDPEATELDVSRVRNLAQRLELEFCEIRSNIAEIDVVGYGLAHSTSNVGGAFLLAGLFRTFIVASGYDAQMLGKDQNYAGSIEPAVLQYLSPPGRQAYLFGSNKTRVAKTREIVDEPEVQSGLDVCLSRSINHLNCGKCEKCLRTLAAVEILGKLDKFEGLFDLHAYRQARPVFFYRMRVSNEVFLQELRTSALAEGHQIDRSVLWRGSLSHSKLIITQLIRKTRGKLGRKIRNFRGTAKRLAARKLLLMPNRSG